MVELPANLCLNETTCQIMLKWDYGFLKKKPGIEIPKMQIKAHNYVKNTQPVHPPDDEIILMNLSKGFLKNSLETKVWRTDIRTDRGLHIYAHNRRSTVKMIFIHNLICRYLQQSPFCLSFANMEHALTMRHIIMLVCLQNIIYHL